MIVDAGSGDSPDPRADLALDLRATDAADARADIEHLPLADNSAQGAVANHVVEHLPDPAGALRELGRVVQPGGWVEVAVPLGMNHASDGDHEGPWSYERPEQYSKAHRRGWDPDLPLTLTNRDLNVWLAGPAAPLSPLFQAAARRWPRWAAHRTAGGELRARYEVLSNG